MLGTHYKTSPLIFGERKWAGRRAPGGPLPEPTIISFGASPQILRELEQAMIQLNSDPRLPVIARSKIEETDPLWRQWQARSNLVAFVRPDGYVGWAALAPTAAETLGGVRKALGMLIGAQRDSPSMPAWSFCGSTLVPDGSPNGSSGANRVHHCCDDLACAWARVSAR